MIKFFLFHRYILGTKELPPRDCALADEDTGKFFKRNIIKAVVSTGSTGSIKPVNFWKSRMEPVKLSRD